MRLPRKTSRSAFTLIELLIVIAIAAVLMALAAGTYFRVRTVQLENATGVTLGKIGSQVDQQFKAVSDQAKSDINDSKVPAAVRAMAGDDTIRVRVIWTKFHQKIQFPQNFWEVVVWAPAAEKNFGISQNPTYRLALNGILPTDPNLIDPTRASPPFTAAEYEQLHNESAALLYLALTQPRRGQGAGFNAVEHLGAHAVGEVTLFGRPFKVFQDTWRRPIAFVRWPFGSAGMDLQAPPFATFAGGFILDPTDPERRLQVASWQNAYGQAFIQSLNHPLTPLNLSPVIFSGGRDKLYGVDHFYTRLGSDEDDNIYGYRVRRAGGR